MYLVRDKDGTWSLPGADLQHIDVTEWARVLYQLSGGNTKRQMQKPFEYSDNTR